jgi:hypothetical protein
MLDSRSARQQRVRKELRREAALKIGVALVVTVVALVMTRQAVLEWHRIMQNYTDFIQFAIGTIVALSAPRLGEWP